MRCLELILLCLAVFLVALLMAYQPARGAEFRPLTREEPIVRMVLQEAANEPFAGQIAVAGVAFDRMKDRRWPSTDRDVVYQPAQFTGMEIRLRQYSETQIKRARAAVVAALIGTRICGTVLWYHTVDIKPSWRKRLTRRCRIGAHIFYGDAK